MKFAYIIMGPFDSKKDRKAIGKNENAEIIGVKDINEAEDVARDLEGKVDVIELCGAFGKDGAKRVINATNGNVPVGYVVHLKVQDRLFEKLFGS